jgi:hypothetical protein
VIVKMSMTEAKWLISTRPSEMLAFLHDPAGWSRYFLRWLRVEKDQPAFRASDRKLRLCAVACCRRVGHLFSEEKSHQNVEAAERIAEGKGSREELEGVRSRAATDYDAASTAAYAASAAAHEASKGRTAYASLAADWAALAACLGRIRYVHDLLPLSCSERVAQCVLLREVFGPLPFGPVGISPSVLTWNDGTVKRLAEGAYEHRLLPSGHLDGERLAVLADALEEAGCTDPTILNHCRQPGEHVRGCWLLDLILNKE